MESIAQKKNTVPQAQLRRKSVRMLLEFIEVQNIFPERFERKSKLSCDIDMEALPLGCVTMI